MKYVIFHRETQMKSFFKMYCIRNKSNSLYNYTESQIQSAFGYAVVELVEI